MDLLYLGLNCTIFDKIRNLLVGVNIIFCAESESAPTFSNHNHTPYTTERFAVKGGGGHLDSVQRSTGPVSIIYDATDGGTPVNQTVHAIQPVGAE